MHCIFNNMFGYFEGLKPISYISYTLLNSLNGVQLIVYTKTVRMFVWVCRMGT